MSWIEGFLGVALFITLVTEWGLQRYQERATIRRTWKAAWLVVARATMDECICQDNPRNPCPACRLFESTRRVFRYQMGKRDEPGEKG